MLLSELTSSARRLALVGLAKNTGKTVALGTLLRELEADGRHVGVTSVGRDGEERDVIDFRIEKPRIDLPGGSLVATTDGLLRASGLPHELLEETTIRTPLGRVLIARLRGPGAVEVAGPSAAEDVRAVADAMLAHGAEQVLIDGAIDRRAASSPDVADQLIISTGAVLDEDIDEVVLQTRDAIDLVRLPSVAESSRTRELANTRDATTSLLVEDHGEPVALAPRFALSAEAAEIGELLDANRTAHSLLVSGALPDRFLRDLLHAVARRHRELDVVVADPTRVFLSKRGPAWYRRQGIHIRVLNPIALSAITVNPIAPGSHHFASARLRSLIEAALPGIPVFDVLDPSYPAAELLAH
ncbi:MAG TPA: hypothetical protein VFY36_05870 [Solirubrobacteraceae bacterium]|nr:hypothetical protein [Solirubrobacteraceae bacterium]